MAKFYSTKTYGTDRGLSCFIHSMPHIPKI